MYFIKLDEQYSAHLTNFTQALACNVFHVYISCLHGNNDVLVMHITKIKKEIKSTRTEHKKILKSKMVCTNTKNSNSRRFLLPKQNKVKC